MLVSQHIILTAHQTSNFLQSHQYLPQHVATDDTSSLLVDQSSLAPFMTLLSGLTLFDIVLKESFHRVTVFATLIRVVM